LTAQILSGKDVAAALRGELAERVASLAERGKSVGLATVLVGDDAASQVYVRGKHRAAEAAGMLSFDHALPASATQEEVEGLVHRLNADASVVDAGIGARAATELAVLGIGVEGCGPRKRRQQRTFRTITRK